MEHINGDTGHFVEFSITPLELQDDSQYVDNNTNSFRQYTAHVSASRTDHHSAGSLYRITANFKHDRPRSSTRPDHYTSLAGQTDELIAELFLTTELQEPKETTSRLCFVDIHSVLKHPPESSKFETKSRLHGDDYRIPVLVFSLMDATNLATLESL